MRGTGLAGVDERGDRVRDPLAQILRVGGAPEHPRAGDGKRLGPRRQCQGLAAGIAALTTGVSIGPSACSLSMAPALDPIGAVVLSADTSCVDTVLVAGRIVKRDGRLVGHDVPAILAALGESAARLAAA